MLVAVVVAVVGLGSWVVGRGGLGLVVGNGRNGWQGWRRDGRDGREDNTVSSQ